MTLPAAPNPISLSQVNVELGLSATATITMNDAAVRTLAGVGGSGTIISMDNLRGKSSIVLTSPFVASTAGTILGNWDEQAEFGPGAAGVSITFGVNGTIAQEFGQGDGSAGYSGTGFQTTWATPAAANPGNSYFIRANLISSTGTGVSSGDITGSWLALSTQRSWGVADTSGSFTKIFTFDLSKDGSTVLATSPQVTLRAVYTVDQSCVSVNSYVFNYGLAKTMRAGTPLFSTSENMLIDEYTTIKYAKINKVPGVKIITEGGVTLECSTTAPIPTEFDSLVKSVNVLGKRVATMRNGIRYWDMVTDVIHIDELEVMHVYANDRCFWAGDTEGSYILHHNKEP